jgi:hypothetical protein
MAQENSNPATNIKSQQNFIRSLDTMHLREFLCRSHSINSRSLLSTAIYNELQANYSKVLSQYNKLHIQTAVKASANYKNPPDIYLVISFKDRVIQPQKTRKSKQGAVTIKSTSSNRKDMDIGHITFHLIPSQCNEYESRGPIHVINNTSTRRARRLHIGKNIQNKCLKYTFTLGSIDCLDICDNLKKMTDAALNVLNHWFDPSNQQTHVKYSMCDAQTLQNTKNAFNTIARWRTTTRHSKT